MTVTRPALRWHGGKWMLAPWIIGHFPTHRCYVEPYGGAMSVLLRKKRSYAEVYNDLDKDVVNFFRVLRSPRAAELREKLALTPFARDEFDDAYMPRMESDDAVERARAVVVRSFMGFGSNAHNRITGFRSNSNRSGTTPAHDWVNYAQALPRLIERLEGVVIENRDAMEVMLQHDSERTLHYVDPPYMFATRGDTSHDYAHEMTDTAHGELLDFLPTLKGSVVLSGYHHPLYDAKLAGWKRFERDAHAGGARKRKEVLWISPNATARPAGLGDM